MATVVRNFPLEKIVPEGIPPLEIMDIGAMLEGEERFFALTARNMAHVTGFEPDEKEFAKLTTTRDPKRFTYHPYFLGDGTEATFHLAGYPGCSSLYPPNPAIIDLFTGMSSSEGGFAIQKKIPVKTHKLDDIEGLALPDLIKLDIQGHELVVLEHGRKALDAALMIEMETEFVPMYIGQPLFCDVQAFMLKHGFMLHKLIDVGGRCYKPMVANNHPYTPMSQVLWTDTVFIRDVTDMSRYSDTDLLKAALLAHELYSSCDLTFFYLKHYDERRGTELKKHYVQMLGAHPVRPFMLNVRTG